MKKHHDNFKKTDYINLNLKKNPGLNSWQNPEVLKTKTMKNYNQNSHTCKSPKNSTNNRLYITLFGMSLKTGECWPRVQTLARKLERSERTIIRWMNTLVSSGKIVRKKKYPKSYYRINLYKVPSILKKIAERHARKMIEAGKRIREKQKQVSQQIRPFLQKFSPSQGLSSIRDILPKMGVNKPSPELSQNLILGGEKMEINEEKNKKILEIYREEIVNFYGKLNIIDHVQKERIKKAISDIENLSRDLSEKIYLFCVIKNFNGEIKSSLEGYYRKILLNPDRDKINSRIKNTLNQIKNRLDRQVQNTQESVRQAQRIEDRQSQAGLIEELSERFERLSETEKSKLIEKTREEAGSMVREGSMVFKGLLLNNFKKFMAQVA